MAKYRSNPEEVDADPIGDTKFIVYYDDGSHRILTVDEFHEKFEKVENQSEKEEKNCNNCNERVVRGKCEPVRDGVSSCTEWVPITAEIVPKGREHYPGYADILREIDTRLSRKPEPAHSEILWLIKNICNELIKKEKEGMEQTSEGRKSK